MNQLLINLLKEFNQDKLIDSIIHHPVDEKEIVEAFFNLQNYAPLKFDQKKVSTKTLERFDAPVKSFLSATPLANKLLQTQSFAAVILAGGDGSRLGSSLPKGCIEFCPKTKKTLFEIHLEKILQAQKKFCTEIPLIILTSKTNHQTIIEFFEKNLFFGLSRSQVSFPIQPVFPFFDLEKKAFFKSPTTIATGPNGNGAIIHILDTYSKLNPDIEIYQIINVDNPLANPVDLQLLEEHLEKENDITLRCIPIENEKQKIGRIFKYNNCLKIVDYTENLNLSLSCFGSINIFSFSKSFIEKLHSKKTFDIHWVTKQMSHFDRKTQSYRKIEFLKGEIFITDAIEHAEKISCLLSNPTLCFAPVKSLEGEGNLIDAIDRYENASKHLIT